MRITKYSKFCPSGDIRSSVHRGYGLLIIAIVAAIMVALISLSVTKLSQAAFSGFNSSKIMHQAQQYAESEAVILKATNYSDVKAHSKTAIQNSNGYLSEIVLSSESNYSDNIKQRTATINIYRQSEALPRYSINVVKTSVEANDSDGVPIGTIIAWASTTAPTEGGTWLLCNGQSCSAYPKLSALVGSTVPNLNGRFLEGTTGTNVRSTKAAGLPNIIGKFNAIRRGWGESTPTVSGAFSSVTNWAGNLKGASSDDWGSTYTFDASKANSIYGASSTVQPPSYLVRYYIKAA